MLTEVDPKYEHICAPKYVDFLKQETEEDDRTTESWFTTMDEDEISGQVKRSKATGKSLSPLVARDLNNSTRFTPCKESSKPDSLTVEPNDVTKTSKTGFWKTVKSTITSNNKGDSKTSNGEEKKSSKVTTQKVVSKQTVKLVTVESKVQKSQQRTAIGGENGKPKSLKFISTVCSTKTTTSRLFMSPQLGNACSTVISALSETSTKKSTESRAPNSSVSHQTNQRRKLENGNSKKVPETNKPVPSGTSTSRLTVPLEKKIQQTKEDSKIQKLPEPVRPAKPLLTNSVRSSTDMSHSSRPTRVKTRYEIDAEIMANMPKFKARPFDVKVLRGDPGLPPVTKRPVTKCQEFHFKTAERAKMHLASTAFVHHTSQQTRRILEETDSSPNVNPAMGKRKESEPQINPIKPSSRTQVVGKQVRNLMSKMGVRRGE